MASALREKEFPVQLRIEVRRDEMRRDARRGPKSNDERPVYRTRREVYST